MKIYQIMGPAIRVAGETDKNYQVGDTLRPDKKAPKVRVVRKDRYGIYCVELKKGEK